RDDLAGRDGDALGVAAAGQQRADLVALRQVRHALADGRDDAGALQPEHLGRAGRRRIVALALQEVGAVDAGGGDLDDDLAGSGLGRGDVGDDEALGSSGLFHDHGSHGSHRSEGTLGCMRATLIQLAATLDSSRNRDLVRERLAAVRDTDLVVLPEATMYDFGEPDRDLRPAAEPLDGPFVGLLTAEARR